MTSSLKCYNCKSNFSDHLSRSFQIVHYVKCLNCGTANSGFNIEVDVLPSSAKMMDVDTALKTDWWHGTLFAGWGEWIGTPIHEKTANVHIGTYGAALSRRGGFQRTHDWHMFKVRIKDDVDITHIIERDSNDNQVKAAPGVAKRYVNIYESPGSISLNINRHDIEVVERKVLTATGVSGMLAAA